jgi:hypothetical protein
MDYRARQQCVRCKKTSHRQKRGGESPMTQERAKSVLAGSLQASVYVAMPFLMGVAGWAFTNILDHEKRLVHIEATYYTQRTGIQQFHDIQGKLSDLQTLVAVRDSQMDAMAATLTAIRKYLSSREGVEALE